MEDRAIKFRAWDGNRMLFSHNNDINHDFAQLEWFFKRLKGTEKLMQFTGLLDKNGREIYEGDFVQLDHFNYPFSVIYIEASACFAFKVKDKLRRVIEHDDTMTVIGNIYESPELGGLSL